MRVQGALIWNISPLMSSAEPPVMYSASLWSIPYEAGAPTRLLYAQERAFLRDLRSAVDKRVEHKIASARRFAVSLRTNPYIHSTITATIIDFNSTNVFRVGTSTQSRQDGRLLPDYLLQPQGLLRQEEGHKRPHHRESTGLPHLRRPQHSDQHLSLRSTRPGRLPGLLPTECPLRVPTAQLDLHLLPWLSN